MHLVTFELSPSHGADAVAPMPSEQSGSATRFTDGALGFESLDLLRPGSRRLGAIMPPGPHGGDVVDLNRALAVRLACEDAGAPEVEADSLLPSDMRALLHGGDSALAIARDAFAWATESLHRFDRPDLERGGVVLARRRVRIHAPVPRPGKLIGVADNYSPTARETARAAAPRSADEGDADSPREPLLFIEASSSVIGTDDDIVLPAASRAVDYEGELAVVIGRSARNVPVATALDHVAGYTIANDVTARDFQETRRERYLGKSCDTFSPMGPWLVTRDEIGDPQKLRLETRVNGEPRQSASTAEMIFPVADLIAFASRLMTLEPGDVILTGTPFGVDLVTEPPRHLGDGDFVEIEIEGIGQLRNHVCAERRERRSAT